MVIEESAAAGRLTHHGVGYFFCSSTCQELFEASPGSYTPVEASPLTDNPE